MRCVCGYGRAGSFDYVPAALRQDDMQRDLRACAQDDGKVGG
ncbi:hypothetical protein [Parasutterella sp.]